MHKVFRYRKLLETQNGSLRNFPVLSDKSSSTKNSDALVSPDFLSPETFRNIKSAPHDLLLADKNIFDIYLLYFCLGFNRNFVPYE